MIDRKTLLLSLSLLLGSPALAQDPPTPSGRDGLAQRVPWSDVPRGEGAPATASTESTASTDPLPPPPAPPPPTAEALASASAQDAEAALARLVLDFVERRVERIERDALTPANERVTPQPPLAADLERRVKELRRQLRRAGSTCPEGYAGFVERLLPELEAAEERAAALTLALGQLSEAARTAATYASVGRALATDGDSLSAAARALLQPQLDLAREALREHREAARALDVERTRAAAVRIERALDDARSIVRNARRGGGPTVQ